jgi:hypothetical protein
LNQDMSTSLLPTDNYPLLTEFRRRSIVARVASWLGISPDSGIKPFRGSIVLFLLGLSCAGLSVLSDAAVLVVPLDNGKEKFCAKFGYLYEPNYGPAYLFFAPIIYYLGLTALRQIQASLSLPHLGKANRIVFNRVVIAGLIVGSFGATFGSEFWPRRGDGGRIVWGDFQALAFGWAQAAAVATYEPGPLVNIHRQVDPSDHRLSVPLQITARPNGPRDGQLPIFFIFLAAALITQSLFACLQWWIILKLILLFAFFAGRNLSRDVILQNHVPLVGRRGTAPN